jgi:hypothetical protein
MAEEPDDEELLRGEDEIYDAWLECQKFVVDLAQQLELSDDELERILARWTKIAKESDSPDGYAVAGLAKHIITIRSLRRMTDMMRPGEEMVPLVELAARMRTKGEA